MVTAKNIRGLRLISRETQTNTLFYLHNAHGDVTQLLDEKGQVIEDYRYDPYGNEEDASTLAFGGNQTQSVWRQEIEKIDNPFRYCGECLDEETGNYYLRARYYDPSIQRFVNEDSYGVTKGASWIQHPYGYCGNNPIKYYDKDGHMFGSILSTVASKALGAANAVLKGRTTSESSDRTNSSYTNQVGGTNSGNTVGVLAKNSNSKSSTLSIPSRLKKLLDDADKAINNAKMSVKRGALHEIAEYVKDVTGYSTAAWLFQHSLQDKPNDVYRSGNSRIAQLIQKDPAFIKDLNAVFNSHLTDEYFYETRHINFDNGDLYYSLHSATIYYSGFRQQDGTWIIVCNVEDKYDYTEFKTIASKQLTIGNLANDWATLTQAVGIIRPYEITVNFSVKEWGVA